VNIILTLKINETDCLQVVSDEAISEVDLFSSIFKFYLKTQETSIKVHDFAVGQELYDFATHIQNCLDNKYKVLKKSRSKIDLGLLWNEYYQQLVIQSESAKKIVNPSWNEERLILFFNHADENNSCITFLYNNDQGDIVLEIASEYPWFYQEEIPEISYQAWLPKYKILYKETISKNIAMKWIEQMLALRDALNKKTLCCTKK
tara:strand:- start:682 stop:1293 length:612 start_codon:yes stop_codon:yes gene_type:complete